MQNIKLRKTTSELNAIRGPKGLIAYNTDDGSIRCYDGEVLGGWSFQGDLAIPQAPGPGPKYFVAGDEDLGYYGTLSDGEFFSSSALIEATGYSEGSIVPAAADLTWLKFSRQGKVLYIPRCPIVRGAKWSTLYQNGMVYGTDDTGYDPFPVDTPVIQDSRVTYGNDTFIVRLPTGSSANPAPDTLGGGEWNDLMYRVWNSDPNGDYWDTFTDEQLVPNPGSVSWCQESYGSDSRVSRGYSAGGNNVVSYWGATDPEFSNNSNYCWRPVLELVE